MAGGYWAADSIATNLEANAARIRANNELETAERYHRGSIAQLSAALAAVRQLDPGHPLTHWRVRDRINRMGEGARTFDEVWKLKIDSADVLAQVAGEFEALKFTALKKLAEIKIKHKRAGWWWDRRDAYFFGGSAEQPTREAAEQLRGRAERLVRSADIDDEIGLDQVLKMAEDGREWVRPDPPPVLQRQSFRTTPVAPPPPKPSPAPQVQVVQVQRQAPPAPAPERSRLTRIMRHR